MQVRHYLIAFATLAGNVAALGADVEGVATTSWGNPLPSTAYAEGVDTSYFRWGCDDTGKRTICGNSWLYSPEATSFASSFDSEFKVGHVAFFNGTSYTGLADSVDLSLMLTFSVPQLGAIPTSFRFNIINTPNTTDPDASADYLLLPELVGSTTFQIGSTAYHVNFVGFRNVAGDGFLLSNGTQFHVREGHRADADIYALVTASSVPESSTLSMLLLALVLLRFRAALQAREQAPAKS